MTVRARAGLMEEENQRKIKCKDLLGAPRRKSRDKDYVGESTEGLNSEVHDTTYHIIRILFHTRTYAR